MNSFIFSLLDLRKKYTMNNCYKVMFDGGGHDSRDLTEAAERQFILIILFLILRQRIVFARGQME